MRVYRILTRAADWGLILSANTLDRTLHTLWPLKAGVATPHVDATDGLNAFEAENDGPPEWLAPDGQAHMLSEYASYYHGFPRKAIGGQTFTAPDGSVWIYMSTGITGRWERAGQTPRAQCLGCGDVDEPGHVCGRDLSGSWAEAFDAGAGGGPDSGLTPRIDSLLSGIVIPKGPPPEPQAANEHEPGLDDDELIAVRGLIQERYGSAIDVPANSAAGDGAPTAPPVGARGEEVRSTPLDPSSPSHLHNESTWSALGEGGPW